MEPTGHAIVSWRRMCYFLTVLLGIQAFFLLHSIYVGPSALTLNKPLPTKPHQLTEISAEASTLPGLKSTNTTNVTDQYFIDEYVDALSAEQCDIAFPDLYYEVERGVAYWRNRRHIISDNDLYMDPEGSIRFLIHRNELRIINATGAYSKPGYAERARGITNLIYRAVESARAGGEALPSVEFTVALADITDPPTAWDTFTTWVWARMTAEHDEERRKKQQRFFLMPNFDLYGMSDRNLGTYHDFRYRALQHNGPLADKIPKAVWRGTAWVNRPIRDGLVNITENATWADVQPIDWNSPTHEHQLQSDQLCDYRYAIHTEGISYSGRLEFLLNCDNLPIIHDLEWTTHYYHLLIPSGPQQNYIPVKRDWSNLQVQVRYYSEHPFQAQLIVQNHLATFRDRYLTRAATSCYIRRLIREYGSVSFRPEVDEHPQGGRNRTESTRGKVVTTRRRRGLSFEELMLNPRDFRNVSDFYGT